MLSSFNLPAPPGFRGIDEHQPLKVYHRHLPHWRQDGASYVVTFRLNDALPQAKLQEIKRHRERWEKSQPKPCDESEWDVFAKSVTRMTERWMDEGFGKCYFKDPDVAKIMADALRFYENTKCSVPCLTVMPNHVHAIMKPHRGYELEVVLKTIKGWVAKQINNRVGRAGSLWSQESYDRIIRDEEHLFRVVQYIGRNGKVANLRSNEYARWISPEWEAAGWGFRTPQSGRKVQPS